ncbi:hypothetical protein PVAND_017362 [Polypedilum vanderplanki]|uniref:Lipase domain-containing protein n=1 Tax=Polypedilum vanderplanki TaxID=319348 RepID=A0A9J6BIU1_POLVA|nr:hypothetical protein PVAND_017362 [Polypedilum vanderplanki]
MTAKTAVLLFLLSLLSISYAENRFRFIFYHDPPFATEYDVPSFRDVYHHPYFGRNRPTVMFHYGIDQTLGSPEIIALLNAYGINGQFNYIIIHYADPSAIIPNNAVALAEGVAAALISLFNEGYNSRLMNLLGWSLGAQIMARASRRVQQISNRQHVIGRLTGLDPWALNVIQSNQIGILSPDDAYWTESVHTEGNSRGDHDSRGHLAFMVNGGVEQPMCQQTLPGNRADCSHLFALTVWTESVRTATPSFPSLQCTSWPIFLSGQCNNNQIAHIGRTGYNEGLRGIYFLQTNMFSPFSRNQAQP